MLLMGVLCRRLLLIRRWVSDIPVRYGCERFADLRIGIMIAAERASELILAKG